MVSYVTFADLLTFFLVILGVISTVLTAVDIIVTICSNIKK